jgi:hypothetical protein
MRVDNNRLKLMLAEIDANPPPIGGLDQEWTDLALDLRDERARTAELEPRALAAELTLGEQLRQMREALEDLCPWVWGEGTSANGGSKQVRRLLNGEEVPQKAFAALALTPSQAEQQVRENAEKAALLEWWFDEANEEARESIRVKRADSTTAWSVEQWLAEVKAAKEPK